MAKIKPMYIETKYGHVDLMIERDCGNPILILMGKTEYALPSWRKLRNLCNKAIGILTDTDAKKVKLELDYRSAKVMRNLIKNASTSPYSPEEQMLMEELEEFVAEGEKYGL